MMHLKYYFGLEGDRLYLDSIACNEEKVEIPPHFLKWYEEGDIDWNCDEIDGRHNDPVFWAMLSPKVITFSLEEAKKAR